MSRSKIFLPDVNVWLALAVSEHMHEEAARAWFDGLLRKQAGFCRVSQMGFLRLLTNERVMGKGDALTQRQAWHLYDRFRDDERVVFFEEAEEFEMRWKALTQRPTSSRDMWTDDYLLAFASVIGGTVVTADRAFARRAAENAFLIEA